MNSDFLIDIDKKYELELASLGDLSRFSFAQLRDELTQFDIIIDNFGSYIIANFESPYTMLQIQYDPSGEFVKIVDQYWK
jgi:hypothetical protein